MSRDRYSYAISQAAERPLVQRGLLGLLIGAGLALMMLEHSQSPAAQRLRNTMLDVVSPLMSVVSRPVTAFNNAVVEFKHYTSVMEENQRLRQENERLWHWQSVAQSMKIENDSLRGLMGYKPSEATSFVTARVIGQAPGNYSQTLILNAGASDTIEPLQPVIDSFGLVGRVTDVAEHTSRVLLLTDTNSRIPVISSDSRQRAILTGTGDDMLRLKFITAEQKTIAVGETILTTAEGNLIPGGIAVGQVFRSDGNGGYLVKPMRPLTQSDYLRVITQ